MSERQLAVAEHATSLARFRAVISDLVAELDYDARLIDCAGQIGNSQRVAVEIVVNHSAGLVFVVAGQNFVATIKIPPEQAVKFAVHTIAGTLCARGLPVRLKRHNGVMAIWPRANAPKNLDSQLADARDNN